MQLLEMIRPECVTVIHHTMDKAAVLRAIARLAVDQSGIRGHSEDDIYLALHEREALVSTGLVRGVALPHCRLARLDAFIGGILSTPEGVRFGSLDGRRSRIFIFVLAPENREEEHLGAMAGLSELLDSPEALETLLAQRTGEHLYWSFCGLWRRLAQHMEESE